MKILYTDNRKALRNEVYQRINSICDERIFLLVPDKQKLEVERWILDERDSAVLFRTEILSFNRFAYRVEVNLAISQKAFKSQLQPPAPSNFKASRRHG